MSRYLALRLVEIAATLVVMSLMGGWLFGSLMDFCVSVFERAGKLVG